METRQFRTAPSPDNVTLKTETRLKGMETPRPGAEDAAHTPPTLKTETRLKGMETDFGVKVTAVSVALFENRDPLKGDGNLGPAPGRDGPRSRL